MPENMRERNAEVQSQCAMEAAFAAYFGELVSEWNPLLDEGGRMRFLWHEDVGAYDVCVQSVGGGEAGLAGGGSEGGAGEEIGAAAHLQAPRSEGQWRGNKPRPCAEVAKGGQAWSRARQH